MNNSDFDPNEGYLDKAYDSIPALGTKSGSIKFDDLPLFFVFYLAVIPILTRIYQAD